MGTRHFGILSVMGRNRVPLPAARRNAFIGFAAYQECLLSNRLAGDVWNKGPTTSAAFVPTDKRIVHDCMCALQIKAKSHFVVVVLPHRLPDIGLKFGLAVEEEKAPAARSSNLAS